MIWEAFIGVSSRDAERGPRGLLSVSSQELLSVPNRKLWKILLALVDRPATFLLQVEPREDLLGTLSHDLKMGIQLSNMGRPPIWLVIHIAVYTLMS